MEGFKLKEMDFSGNLAIEWEKFRQNWEFYVTAFDLDKLDENRKVARLLCAIGQQGVETYNSFALSEDDKNKLEVVLKKFEQAFKPKTNLVYERYKFFSKNQNGQTYETYFTKLQNLAKSCKFGQLKNSLIRGRIICGIDDNLMREKLLLLDDTKLPLEKCMSTCITTKDALEHGKQVSASRSCKEDVNVDKIQFQQQWKNASIRCTCCGVKHRAGSRYCPAYNETCYRCGKQNHFAKVCRAEGVRDNHSERKELDHNNSRICTKNQYNIQNRNNSSEESTDDDTNAVENCLYMPGCNAIRLSVTESDQPVRAFCSDDPLAECKTHDTESLLNVIDILVTKNKFLTKQVEIKNVQLMKSKADNIKAHQASMERKEKSQLPVSEMEDSQGDDEGWVKHSKKRKWKIWC